MDVTTLTEYQARDELPVRGRLSAARHRLAGRAPVAPRQAPAPRRRDGEVRPRHLLLQRRRRGAVPRRGAHPRAVEPRGADLRPRAGDERRADHRRASSPRIGSRRLRLHRRQLREPRHGRPHRRLGRRPSRPPSSSTPASAALARAALGPRARRWSSPPTTATSRRCATPDGSPQTKHTTSPVPFVLVGESHARTTVCATAILADVAPTLCELLGIPPGPEMTGAITPRPSRPGRGLIGLC